VTGRRFAPLCVGRPYGVETVPFDPLASRERLECFSKLAFQASMARRLDAIGRFAPQAPRG
jgi:hypothetical protein